MRDDLVLQLRHCLASIGLERTPSDVRQVLSLADQLYDKVTLEVYRAMRDMSPGDCYMMSVTEKMSGMEALSVRNLILYTGERKFPEEKGGGPCRYGVQWSMSSNEKKEPSQPDGQ